jgi:hypothetical protein
MLASEREKREWVEKHARRLQGRFAQWQKPLHINGAEYRKYLIQELSDCYDEPLRKSLMESVS